MKSSSNNYSESEIKYYQGPDGLLQISLHSLETDELLIYESSYASLNKMFSPEKAEEIRQEFLKRGVKIREITNKAYQEEYTAIKEFNDKCMSFRYIDAHKLDIAMDFLVYNDIVAYYSLSEPIFGIEIKNQRLADMQRQIFNFVWNSGERPIIGPNGRTSIF
jgi:hypothetical protein